MMPLMLVGLTALVENVLNDYGYEDGAIGSAAQQDTE